MGKQVEAAHRRLEQFVNAGKAEQKPMAETGSRGILGKNSRARL